MIYKGKWALVTGASAGIGEAFARSLAARGANLILTARRGERLKRLAEELKEKYGVETLAIEADLSQPDAPDKIAADIAAAGGQVDLLINNAGYGLPGRYEQSSWAIHRDFIELMVTSYAHLVRIFLPGMQARRYGRIINVASLAGLTPSAAGHTMYGASKAFLISFSQALAAENADTGVNVCALCPGFTYSEFHDVNKMRDVVNRLPDYMFMKAAPVVEGALIAVEARRPIYVPGRWNKFVAWLMRALPRSWAAALVARQSHRFRSGDAPNV
ncbi:MAG: dehydrogenase [Gammaproteobacteria bacterium RIFCSPHIGHO2_12_FULL_63_22]|nr:MAG: dehydrogenase [Gammaproteobacteria bacterium RIFCSPHIGHO2_12_FULL_63_22]